MKKRAGGKQAMTKHQEQWKATGAGGEIPLSESLAAISPMWGKKMYYAMVSSWEKKEQSNSDYSEMCA